MPILCPLDSPFKICLKCSLSVEIQYPIFTFKQFKIMVYAIFQFHTAAQKNFMVCDHYLHGSQDQTKPNR